MAARTRPRPRHETIKELLVSLGRITPDRVRLDPVPGTATTRDVIRLHDAHKRRYELIDGILVEKIGRLIEAYVGVEIIVLLGEWNRRQGNPGMILNEAGAFRLAKRLVRFPDVSFTRWDRLPNRKVPNAPIPDLAPDLAVEVLSRKNTKGEMARKLKEYFLAGVQLVWFINPQTRTVRTFTSPDEVAEFGPEDTLDGGAVLPDLQVPIARLFASLEDERPAPKPGKRPS